MPWFRLNDKAWSSAKLRAVGKSARGGLVMLWAYAAYETTDGWLPAYIVAQELEPDELDALITVRMNGRAGLLHPYGEECDCLVGRPWTQEMGGYWIHDFVAGGNPSRAEHDLRQAKARELRDRDLLLLVRERDGNACRYCGRITPWSDHRSKYRLTYDHVDPTRAGGLDNLVVCCLPCNQRKAGARTPEAAGMTLLPPPAGRPPAGGWSPNARRPIKRVEPAAEPTNTRRGTNEYPAHDPARTKRKPAGNNPSTTVHAQVIPAARTVPDQGKGRSSVKPVIDHLNGPVQKVSRPGRVGSGLTTDAGTGVDHPPVMGQLSIGDLDP